MRWTLSRAADACSGPVEERIEEVELFLGSKSRSLNTLGCLGRKWDLADQGWRCALNQEADNSEESKTPHPKTSLEFRFTHTDYRCLSLRLRNSLLLQGGRGRAAEGGDLGGGGRCIEKDESKKGKIHLSSLPLLDL